MAMDKFNALSTGEKLIVGGGALMLIASIFPWYRFSELGFSFSESGWGDPGSIWSILAILLSVALAGIVLAMRIGNMTMPSLPENLTWGAVYGGGAAVLIVLMLLKAWRILDVPVGGFGFGFYLAVVATAIIVVGGYQLYSADKPAVRR